MHPEEDDEERRGTHRKTVAAVGMERRCSSPRGAPHHIYLGVDGGGCICYSLALGRVGRAAERIP